MIPEISDSGPIVTTNENEPQVESMCITFVSDSNVAEIVMGNSTSKLSTITNSDQTEEYESDSDESTFDDELEN